MARLYKALCAKPEFGLSGLFTASEKCNLGRLINLDNGDSIAIIKKSKTNGTYLKLSFLPLTSAEIQEQNCPTLRHLDQLDHQMHDFEDSLAIVETDTTLCKILFHLEYQHLQLVQQSFSLTFFYETA